MGIRHEVGMIDAAAAAAAVAGDDEIMVMWLIALKERRR
jgi:hypothetical protein